MTHRHNLLPYAPVMSKHLAALFIAAMGGIAVSTLGQPRPFYRQGVGLTPGSGGDVALPYTFDDNTGDLWRIYNNGWMQEDGDAPVINQAALIYINGAPAGQVNNQAHLDANTGELVVEGMGVNGIDVTRRLLFNKRLDLLRYIDIFHNSNPEQQTVTVSITTNLNFAMTAAHFIPDPKKPDHNLAWVAQTSGGKSLVQVFGGSGAQISPAIDWQQGASAANATLVMNVPAGHDRAIVHFHALAVGQDAGVKFAESIDPASLLRAVPPALRKIILNFPQTQEWVGDIELLRGDIADVVELRNGDRFRGTLATANYKLETAYGSIDLPADGVAGIVSTGQTHARQLIVATDGQIFGGRMANSAVEIQLGNGQSTRVPLAQINRVGYHKRDGETEEWKFDKPLLTLRGGDRLLVNPTAPAFDVSTRYGKLTIKPSAIAEISFQNDDEALNEITLNDGSRFGGLALGDEFEFALTSLGRSAKFKSSALSKLRFVQKLPEIDDRAPTLHLQNHDLLVGTIAGTLKLETGFDALTLNARDIRLLSRDESKPLEVHIAMWDGSLLSGRLADPLVNCQLRCGVEVKVPPALIEEFSQPPAKGQEAPKK